MSNDHGVLFVGAPFSAAMTTTEEGVGFDSTLRSQIDRVLTCAKSLGFSVLSSHVADRYGTDFVEDQIVRRDNSWVRECDLYVALLPLTSGGGPYRTDGTFVEIGLALGCGKRVLAAIEDIHNPEWSYYVRNISAATENLAVVDFRSLLDNAENVLKKQMALAKRPALSIRDAEDRRQQTTDAIAVLAALSERSDIERVNFKGMDLEVMPGVFSPRVSHAPDYIVDNWSIPPNSSVLDIGCGCGILGLYALFCGAASLVAIDINLEACRNTTLNAEHLGYASRTRVIEGDAYSQLGSKETFDVIIIAPPYWNRRATTPLEAACFDEDYRFLTVCISGASSHLAEHGSVFLVFSDQGDLAYLARQLQASGLMVKRILAQRPTMPGGHIRFFYHLVHS